MPRLRVHLGDITRVHGARIAEVRANREPSEYTPLDDASDARLLLSLLDGWAGHRE